MLTVTDLSFERYFEPVFQPVSFGVGAGDLLLVTGDNGSGKTTLIRLLAGILRPSGGQLGVAAGGVAYVGHLLALKDDLSVEENLTFVRDFMGVPERDIAAAVNRVGLNGQAEQPARTLSAGQRKRCALARLLLTDAPLWLLDEPYSNLDRQGMAMMDGLLRDHAGRGGACVLTTHGSLRPEGFDLQECHLSPAGPVA